MISQLAQRIVASRTFHATIIAVILFAGVLVGIETSAAFVARHGPLLHTLDAVVLAIFIAEIVLKMAAHGRRPLDYFRDRWNVFDFTIVALCVLPVGGPFAAVLRLVRTLRLLRLITALPKLQLLVGALLRSLSSMGYVSLLLGLLFYIYAITGIHLFGLHASQYFGSLSVAMLSLFQMVTLDNWAELFHAAREHAPIPAVVYFVSFILLGTMIMLNLFIGVITTSMSEMHAELDGQKEATRAPAEKGSILSDVNVLNEQLIGLHSQLEALRAKLSQPYRQGGGY
jgi:voltage-gated sodium channel